MAEMIHGYEMRSVGEPPVTTRRPFVPLAPEEVRIRVAGCGLCHTDLGFLFDGVRTRHPLPLILGHEISGVVEAAGEHMQHWIGQAVVVPAVLNCGACEDCRDGRPMICRKQIMPGNDRDGGFASHVVLPGHVLCPVPGASSNMRPHADLGGVPGLTLSHLAVIADAVSTPFQALRRAEVEPGDVVVVIGLGGVGGYAAQLAAAFGAHVVGIDVDLDKLAEARGCELTLNGHQNPRDLRDRIKAFAKEVGARTTRHKIVECSGTTTGQSTAWGLLVHGATLCVVGYTQLSVAVRLSNLMAFDARAIGNWGCDPALYPEIVQMVLDGRIDVVGPSELRPLSDLPEAIATAHHRGAARRLVFVPDLDA